MELKNVPHQFCICVVYLAGDDKDGSKFNATSTQPNVIFAMAQNI
jgi:hypothetical protein